MSNFPILNFTRAASNESSATLQTLQSAKSQTNIKQLWALAMAETAGVSARGDSPKKQRPHQPFTCRICLEDCQNLQHCWCSGGMLCHPTCLLEYIKKKRTSKLPTRNQGGVGADLCEICKYPYKIITQQRCKISFDVCNRRIKYQPLKFGMYMLFFILVLSFYAYMGSLLRGGPLPEDVATIMLAVAVCISILFLFFGAICLHDYLVIKQNTIVRVATLKQQQIQQQKRARKLSKSSVVPFDITVEDMI